MKIYEKDGAVRLHAHVQPRAARSEVVGEFGDAVKIRIAAPPVEGEANAELERFIARLVGVAKSQVQVVSGASSKQKVIAIDGTSIEVVTTALERALRKRS